MKNRKYMYVLIFSAFICIENTFAYTLEDITNIYNKYGEIPTKQILTSIGNCTAEEANSLIEISRLNKSIHKKIIITEPNALQTKPLLIGRVTSVLDGYAIKIDTGHTISLIGVNIPEQNDAYSKIASIFLRNLLVGETVYIENEPNQNGYDKSFVYLYRYPDGLFVNAELIRQGYGKCYTKLPFKYMSEFQSLENTAKETPKGLWKLENNSYPPITKTNNKNNSLVNNSTSNNQTKPSNTDSSSTAAKKYETSENNYTSNRVYVNGYYRKDGTYVRGYYRRKPRR